jgi:meso-butanediol dehydrogenase/(S,S)-butanediol dehydrogenase/diacetyl reductase
VRVPALARRPRGGFRRRVPTWCKPDNIASELPLERTLALEVDVADSAAIGRTIAQTVEKFGQLDVLVNNAGTAEGGDPVEIEDEAWHKVISTNLDGVFFGRQ